jgi:hypothetical protein
MSSYLSNSKLHPIIQRTLIILFLILGCSPFYLNAEFIEPSEVNLIDPPVDSMQKTMWKGFPVIIHRRTETQVNELQNLFDATPSEGKRLPAYRSIARSQSHALAIIIMEFTEKYISEKNVYMSEVPEFGIFSMVSPILGCAIFKGELPRDFVSL